MKLITYRDQEGRNGARGKGGRARQGEGKGAKLLEERRREERRGAVIVLGGRGQCTVCKEPIRDRREIGRRDCCKGQGRVMGSTRQQYQADCVVLTSCILSTINDLATINNRHVFSSGYSVLQYACDTTSIRFSTKPQRLQHIFEGLFVFF